MHRGNRVKAIMRARGLKRDPQGFTIHHDDVRRRVSDRGDRNASIFRSPPLDASKRIFEVG
jgi:hypothetical protein